MSAARDNAAVVGQAAELVRSLCDRTGRARGTDADELAAVLGWLAAAETRSAIDLAPLAVLAEIVTLLCAADARQP